jgi:HAD superfamily hydrolase (TIGR01509 family)
MFHREYRWIEGIEALLIDLKSAGVSMHTLSNYPIWYLLVEDAIQLSRYLPWTFVSHNTGVRKPSAEAYSRAAETLGVAPEVCLFVDDRGTNCRGAVDAGMRAIQFEGAEALRTELRALGVPGA